MAWGQFKNVNKFLNVTVGSVWGMKLSYSGDSTGFYLNYSTTTGSTDNTGGMALFGDATDRLTTANYDFSTYNYKLSINNSNGQTFELIFNSRDDAVNKIGNGLTVFSSAFGWGKTDKPITVTLARQSKVAVPTIPLSSQLISEWVNGKVPGTILTIAGKEFHFIKKNDDGTVKVIDKTGVPNRQYNTVLSNTFDLSSSNNVAYYLNNTYYNSLPNDIKAAVVQVTWNVGSQINEAARTAVANVGLLTVSEFNGALSSRNPISVLPSYTSAFEWTVTVSSDDQRIFVIDKGYSTALHTATQKNWIRPALVLKSDLKISTDGTVLFNEPPTVKLDTPTSNQTLYENDVFNIAGTASDADNGNSVTIRYQVNANTARAIKAFVSNGTAEVFTKQLTFKSGNLYDGETLIASNLTDGVAHTLKVWATDDQGGQSSIVERTFYTVPNRAPSLTVNAPSTVGNTDADKIHITGTFNDADGNTTTVKYRVNGSNSVQLAEGTSGDFEFDVSFGLLQLGVNNIVIEAIDSYGSKTSRTVKLNKTATETPILKSTARYQIQPPTGSAKAVLLWVTRDADLQLEVSLSMTMQGEQESFVPVVASNSAPSPDFANAIEDEFYLESDDAKDNIILQLDMTRASLDVNPKVYIIQGVLE